MRYVTMEGMRSSLLRRSAPALPLALLLTALACNKHGGASVFNPKK